MKTLAVANQKGGVGKTAILVHLAWLAAEKGLKTAVIDLDTQGNASFTLAKASRTGLKASQFLFDRDFTIGSAKNLTLIHADAELADTDEATYDRVSKNLQYNIQCLEDVGYDLCLIDTAPSLGVSLVSALYGAQYVLSPIELEAYSIQGIKKMLAVISNIKTAQNPLQFIGMVPSKVDGRNPRHKRHLEELSNAYPDLVLKDKVGLRSSIADALASQVPVWSIKKTAARKAASEVKAVGEYVFTAMGLGDEDHE